MLKCNNGFRLCPNAAILAECLMSAIYKNNKPVGSKRV